MNVYPKRANLITLVTGSCRSGKSEWAEGLATQSEKSVIYVATAQADPDDLEWQNRIDLHQRRRPADWKTLAVPVEIAAAIQSAEASECLLIDSLGTWLANCLEQDEAVWQQTVQQLMASLEQTSGSIILVAEETGWGVVPAYPMGRLFRDRLGNLTRQVGAIAHTVYLVTAGYALDLTQLGTPLQNQKALKL
ncbi:MAG: bifunctional adenosylcobinamide kinase/adenosylcobinamide-phosphate guanylyltransferase [Leptolyngbyaceae cyanobacterium CSU_1_4]|nr:bifunctional adenosylcobinamide kinase/adenosylcobinamide-phosphate guanylyltransferase [Leptolyngbyaceae cyanobacterium CSU_1_4]